MDISALAPATTSACCARDQEHCHDTLVLHLDGTVECSGSDCVVITEVHDHVVVCSEVSPPCGCTREHDLNAAA
ncbi:MAG TPA: hypothetical protein VMY34_04970 [Acidimicrobiales bacterium]|nr:hypothetical protein [Acidimicrobiales bacterium]